MHSASYSLLSVWSLAAVIGIAGLVNVAAPPAVRRLYADWDFPPRFRFVAGFFELAAAVLLSMPELRGWGIGLTGLIFFGAVIMLLDHRRYLSAATAIVLMLALVPAAFAVPREDHHVHYTNLLLAA